MKCKTVEQAINRYGKIDLVRKHWPEESKWIKPLIIPDGWFNHFHVMDTSHKVTNIVCNIDIHEPLLAALKLISDKGLGDVLKSYDGAFNIRAVRGSSHVSAHAYGLALDLNASLNPLGAIHGDFTHHMDVVNCFKGQGFDWGGDFHSRKDQMHFSFCWE